MSSLPDEYEMETRTSDVIESSNESRALTQSVDNNVVDDTNRNEEYYVITEEDQDEIDLIQNVDNPETTDANLVDLTDNWIDVCRICANTSDHLIPIFEGEGMDHELSSKIHSHLPIQVSEQDSLPLHLCYHCAATLLAWHELAEGCLDAEQRLLQMQNDLQKKQTTSMVDETLNEPNIGLKTEESHIQNINQMSHTSTLEKVDCNEESGSNNDERCHSATKKSLSAFRTARVECLSRMRSGLSKRNRVACKARDNAVALELPRQSSRSNSKPAISSVIKEESAIDDTVSIHQLRPVIVNSQRNTSTHCSRKLSSACSGACTKVPEMYSCQKCERIFKREFNLRRHVASCTTIKVKKKPPATDIATETENVDAESIDSRDEAEANTSKTHQKSLNKFRRESIHLHRCTYCDYSATRKKLLEAHHLDSHSDVSSRDKQTAQPRNTDKEAIKRARVEVDGRVHYHCNQCGKDLYSPYTFSWHIRIHTGERPYTCHLCGRQFRVNQGLARHLRETHAGIKNFPCDICGRMFSTKRNAEDHRRIHTGERPFVCNACGKSFKQKASLFVHKRTHTDFFPFKCSYCNQGFRTRPPLMVHITKHTGEKPHACDICNRHFRIKYELKRHRLVHFEEKPWLCTDCGLAFKQKRYLVNHNKINHNANDNERQQ